MLFTSWQADAVLHRAIHQFPLLTIWSCALLPLFLWVEDRHARVRLSTVSSRHFADGPSKAKESYSGVNKQLHWKKLFISLTWSAGRKVSPPSSKYWSTPSSSPSLPPSAPPISWAGYSSPPRPGTNWLGSSPGSIFNWLCWVLVQIINQTNHLYSL